MKADLLKAFVMLLSQLVVRPRTPTAKERGKTRILSAIPSRHFSPPTRPKLLLEKYSFPA